MMKLSKFTNGTFVLYNILPIDKKIDFLHQLKTKSIEDVSLQTYHNLFSDIISNDGVVTVDVGILTYTIEDHPLNIFFMGDHVHINCNRLVHIKDFISDMLINGELVVRDFTMKKTSKNKGRYHHRFYRAYKIINQNNKYPISLS